jgi:hypothetical protein
LQSGKVEDVRGKKYQVSSFQVSGIYGRVLILATRAAVLLRKGKIGILDEFVH